MIPRRALLAALGIPVLSGCGFRPLYMQDPSGTVGGTTAEMARIYVPVMPERSGQLLRQALQQRFEGAGSAQAKQYELVATFQIGAEGIAIQRDSSTSRIRLDGRSTWLLRTFAPGQPVVTQGNARVVDGYNIVNQQFFAAELENDVVVRRMATSLADQITIQLAAYFRQQASPP